MNALRTRLLPTLLLALTIAAGLGVRALLGGFWAKYLGVALWSTAVYWTVLWIRPTLGWRRAAVITAVVSWAVEFFQLTPYPAALAARSRLLHLLLGSDFGAGDLPAYLIGVLLAALAHARLAPRLTADLSASIER